MAVVLYHIEGSLQNGLCNRLRRSKCTSRVIEPCSAFGKLSNEPYFQIALPEPGSQCQCHGSVQPFDLGIRARQLLAHEDPRELFFDHQAQDQGQLAVG